MTANAFIFKGNGTFGFPVVGESHYQANIAALAGEKTTEGHDIDCLACLVLEDENPYDKKAVAVGILRRAKTALKVGYLPRAEARSFRKAYSKFGERPDLVLVCRARIVGGWLNDAGPDGMYGVRIDLKLPLTLYVKSDHLLDRLL